MKRTVAETQIADAADLYIKEIEGPNTKAMFLASVVHSKVIELIPHNKANLSFTNMR